MKPAFALYMKLKRNTVTKTKIGNYGNRLGNVKRRILGEEILYKEQFSLDISEIGGVFEKTFFSINLRKRLINFF